jgi:hypothetical protein
MADASAPPADAVMADHPLLAPLGGLARGAITVLYGPTGCGRTTLCVQLQRACAGRVFALTHDEEPSRVPGLLDGGPDVLRWRLPADLAAAWHRAAPDLVIVDADARMLADRERRAGPDGKVHLAPRLAAELAGLAARPPGGIPKAAVLLAVDASDGGPRYAVKPPPWLARLAAATILVRPVGAFGRDRVLRYHVPQPDGTPEARRPLRVRAEPGRGWVPDEVRRG